MMIIAGMASVILDRENALLHALALAGLLILAAAPQALFDISFQLSFVSVWTIGSVVLLWAELQLRPTGKVVKVAHSALLLVIVSLSASLATGPLVAHYFNQVSFAGLLANMVVVPVAGMVIVPIGLASGIVSLFTGHLALPGLNQFVADGFISVVTFFAELPFAEFHPPSPGIVWLCCYAVLLVSLFLILSSRLRTRLKPFEYPDRIPVVLRVLAPSSAFMLVLLSAMPLFSSDRAEVCFPDVGQGDSALIRLPGNRNILVDGGGTYDDRFDMGRRVLAPYLWNKGIRRLDLVILSHPHPDHMNGLKFVLQKFEVAEIWSHGQDLELPGYGDLRQIAAGRNIMHRTVTAGDPSVFFGPAELRVLHPAPGFRSPERKGYAAENDRSLVVRVRLDSQVMLFTGDIGKGGEQSLLRSGEVKCDLIKIAHHGSKSSSSPDFVQAAHPQLAVVSVGRGNRYHHPSEMVLAEYERTGARILRTDQNGSICIETDEGGFRERRWSDRELKRIGMNGERAAEQENWKRVWLSIREL
jgi:competence protein ComEC